MLINRNNYESFFLDFVEGRMSAEDQAGLMAFLAENPDLQKELDAFENIQLESTEEQFSNKSLLKKDLSNVKEITDLNFDYYCIAKMEGDLDEDGNKLFDKYISEHPERLKDYKQLLQTFLEPDKNIVFAEKQKLRHRHIQTNKSKVLTIVSFAASIALIIISYQFYNSYREQNKKIYTAIHEKLKIDSLITASLTPKEGKKIEEVQAKSVKRNTSLSKPKDTLFLAHKIFRPKKPIEIIQLDGGIETTEIQPLSSSRPIVPLLAMENRKSYLTIGEYAERQLKKKLDIQDLALDKNLTLWKAAETGAKQLNKLTGMNIRVNKEFDSINNRTKVIIHSNLLSFYSSTKK